MSLVEHDHLGAFSKIQGPLIRIFSHEASKKEWVGPDESDRGTSRSVTSLDSCTFAFPASRRNSRCSSHVVLRP